MPVDRDAWFVADDPGIVAWCHDREIAWAELHLLAVVHDDVHPTRDEVAHVGGLTAVRLRNRLHVLRPPPARQERGAADGTCFEVHQLELTRAIFERSG